VRCELRTRLRQIDLEPYNSKLERSAVLVGMRENSIELRLVESNAMQSYLYSSLGLEANCETVRHGHTHTEVHT